MCDVLGLGSNRSRLLAGRAPVCPSRSYLPAAHRTHGSSSPHWPTREMRQELDTVTSTEFMTSDDLPSTYSMNYLARNNNTMKHTTMYKFVAGTYLHSMPVGKDGEILIKGN